MMDRLFRKPINFLQGVVVFLFVITNSPAQGQIKQEYLPQSQSNQILQLDGNVNKPVQFRIKKFEFKAIPSPIYEDELMYKLPFLRSLAKTISLKNSFTVLRKVIFNVLPTV
ncbi:hypothetical protein BC008_00780 [Mastigocoleus testarum BC008]|uniref:Uncharacterized protein n=1 Tax=Mastigocoleus testarum BC008 TaxID=371196 RepID=A0A0V7ZG37_9CYAN|nr:hypothetical protein BC008_13915 [Mastigocoleus testarum BC008]KST68437.1 hypothetical protein BC008_00780 [Mastigocoleus testarum BC008]